jgi:hypothetical protein
LGGVALILFSAPLYCDKAVTLPRGNIYAKMNGVAVLLFCALFIVISICGFISLFLIPLAFIFKFVAIAFCIAFIVFAALHTPFF